MNTNSSEIAIRVIGAEDPPSRPSRTPLEDPSFPNPKCPTLLPSPGRLARAGGDGGVYPSGAAVGSGGGFLGRCSGELVGGGGGPWAARLGVAEA
jgi:hypothetical protein